MSDKYTSFRGTQVSKDWPDVLKDAQKKTVYHINGADFSREPHTGYDETDICHDCVAEPGELHVPGCDVERCPCCGGQAISCSCKVDATVQDKLEDLWEEEDE